jgi:hypothetical protein
MEYEKKLGKIKSAELFIEDHGILTFFLHFDFGGSGQGFGGYTLDAWDKNKDRRIGTVFGMDLILKLLQTFDVDRLEQIVGRTCFALYDVPYRWNDAIRGIETPKFDGGKKFIISEHVEEWCANEEWFKKEKAEKAFAGKAKK